MVQKHVPKCTYMADIRGRGFYRYRYLIMKFRRDRPLILPKKHHSNSESCFRKNSGFNNGYYNMLYMVFMDGFLSYGSGDMAKRLLFY